MNRREALSYAAALLGGTVIGSEVFLSGCSRGAVNVDAEVFDISLLDEIGETIFPETTESPGAKAARIGEFMKTIVSDCYTADERSIFLAGQGDIQKRSRDAYGKNFTDLSPMERLELLTAVDREVLGMEDASKHYFTMMRQLTVWGYFSSEAGATKALRYNQTPGRFEGCIPYTNDDAAWSG